MENNPSSHNGLSQLEMDRIAQDVRERLRQQGIDPISVREDDRRLQDLLYEIQMDEFESGREIDSLDVSQIAMIVTDPGEALPPDSETGVREPRRPRPSGSAGAIALEHALED